jgi:hypothetical protein
MGCTETGNTKRAWFALLAETRLDLSSGLVDSKISLSRNQTARRSQRQVTKQQWSANVAQQTP